jgi:hypothetical protein
MRKVFVVAATVVGVSIAAWSGPSARAVGHLSAQDYQSEFTISQRSLDDSGQSRYFVLDPGYYLILEGGGERVTISVLHETREINGISTRIVEERSEENGELTELASNFFALDPATGDVFYFGEDVNIYDDDMVTHEGSWLAYEHGSQPGLYMPGAPVVGMRYYQEVAPGIAEDRAEVISTTDRVSTPAGDFENCLRTRESSPIDPGVTGEKVYAPGIGLVQDGALQLVSYGYFQGVVIPHESGYRSR